MTPEGGAGGEPRPRKPAVLYVMGYGRSGSTLLDILLDNASGVTGLGEVWDYHRWLVEERPCACGRPLPACDFWGDVVRAHRERVDGASPGRALDDQRRVEHLRALPRLTLGSPSGERMRRYGEVTATLFEAIVERAGGDALVDSSGGGVRVAGRPLALDRYADVDLRVVHLVRDGRAVVWSALRGPGSPERKAPRLPRPLLALRTAAAWAFTNLTCEWIARALGPDRVLRLRYEDLVADPASELRRLAAFAGLDLEEAVRKVEAGEPLEVGHVVAGNRLRFEETVTIRPDLSWREEMSSWHRLKLTLELWPWLLRYGYPLWPGPEAGR